MTVPNVEKISVTCAAVTLRVSRPTCTLVRLDEDEGEDEYEGEGGDEEGMYGSTLNEP